ncbi:hypothetical protein L7F22_041563 [Adiantum nelumboides]|nr:hypothetical protein [Adiantum nelumboides]
MASSSSPAASVSNAKFRLNTGRHIPAVGLGTVNFTCSEDEVCAAIFHAIQIGYRHIDTAKYYGTERAIGRALQRAFEIGVVTREDMFITSKLWCDDNHPDDVLPALQNSLRALGLEFLDLYLMHFPVRLAKGARIPPKEHEFLPVDVVATWRAMETCQQLGLSRAIGVSNFSSCKLTTLLRSARVVPAVNQQKIISTKKARFKGHVYRVSYDVFFGELNIPIALYVAIDIDGNLVGFLSVYAPNSPRERASFWSQLTDALPIVDTWIIGGDFNNIESDSDWCAETRPILSSISPREQEQWDRFLLATHSADALHISSFGRRRGSLSFSWGFHGEVRLLERLDRFYVGAWTASRGGSTHIEAGTVLSDHLPVSMIISFGAPIAPKRGTSILDRILLDADLLIDLQRIWSTDSLSSSTPAEPLASCIIDSSLACRTTTASHYRVEVHPLWQQQKLREFCHMQGVHVSAWSPLGAPGTKYGSNEVLTHPTVAHLAHLYSKSTSQIVLKWALQNGISVLPKSYNPSHQLDNFQLCDWDLKMEDMELMSTLSQRRISTCDYFCNKTTSPFKSTSELWDEEE